MKKLLFLNFLLFSGQIWGLGLTGVNIEDVSSSRKSLVLNMGTLEDFNEGIFAKFYIQKGPKEFPKIFLVGEGELVKSFPKKSYWLLKRIYIPDVLKKNATILILTSTEVTAGRPLKIAKKHIVLSENEYSDVDDYLDKNQNSVPDRLIKMEKNYEASSDIFHKKELKEKEDQPDVLVSTYENFYRGDDKVNLAEIKKNEDKKVFDSLSTGAIAKTNNMKYGIRSFYSEQEREVGLSDIARKGSTPSVYDENKLAKKEADVISPKYFAKIKRDGEQWSSDMDDGALRQYFIQTGMEKERERRELALNEMEGHEVIINFSNALVSHSNASDPNYKGRAYNIGLSYDLHLARTSANLKKWSLQFLIETGIAQYDTGFFTARSRETSYGAYLNYYFINNPQTLHSFIWLMGLGIKNGQATLFSPELSREYSYQVLSLPALQIMTKYRFRSGDLREDNVNVGASLNFGINVDIKKLSLINVPEDVINSNISISDLKYTAGISFYF